jgi:hypothetical protein
MTSSSRQQQHLLRHLALMEATDESPWSVDATSAIPKDVMSLINPNNLKYVTGCMLLVVGDVQGETERDVVVGAVDGSWLALMVLWEVLVVS